MNIRQIGRTITNSVKQWWVQRQENSNDLSSQPVFSRLVVLIGLMLFTQWVLNWATNIITDRDMYWQLRSVITIIFFYRMWPLFLKYVPEYTTVIINDEWLGKLLGERHCYQGPGYVLTFPWEWIKPDNSFTNETFTTKTLDETIPAKDGFRAIIRGYMTVGITRDGSRIFNARGDGAKEQVLNYLDGLFRRYASSVPNDIKVGTDRVSVDDIVDGKATVVEGFMPYLQNHATEMFDLYGCQFKDCQIKEVDVAEESRDTLKQRSVRAQQIDGDKVLMNQVFKTVEEHYGKEITPDQRRDAADSIMAGMSATGDNVRNSVTSLAGVNTADLVNAILQFLKNNKKES